MVWISSSAEGAEVDEVLGGEEDVGEDLRACRRFCSCGIIIAIGCFAFVSPWTQILATSGEDL